jgi:hypothetical protein
VIKPEIRLPLSAVFFFGIGIPFIFLDNLGLFTATCFALASLALFYVFALMPRNLKQRYINLKNQHRHYPSVFLDYKKKVDEDYHQEMNLWIGAAVTLLVLGIVGFLVSR